MKHKGEDCYSVTREETLSALRSGGVLRWGKLGPMICSDGKELHPRRDTVEKLISEGLIIESSDTDANETQRSCGDHTYRIAAVADAEQNI